MSDTLHAMNETRKLWQMVDWWADQRAHLATCRGVGCNACCRGQLQGTPIEALLMFEAMSPELYERMKTWAPEDPDTAICPLLLEDGRCGVYDARPMVCRVRLAINEPEVCDPVKTPGGVTKTIVDSELVIMSAWFAPVMDLFPTLRKLVEAFVGHNQGSER